MASTNTPTAVTRVLGTGELFDNNARHFSFADVLNATEVCHQWRDQIATSTVQARLFLTLHKPKPKGAIVAIWLQDSQKWIMPGPLDLNTWTAEYSELTEGYDTTSIPRLHPSVARSQKLLHCNAFNGYPTFTVLPFEPKVQDHRFIKDMHEDASPYMLISQPPAKAAFIYAEGELDVPRDFDTAGYLNEDGVCLLGYETMLLPRLKEMRPGVELQGLLIIPHDEKWADALARCVNAKPFDEDGNLVEDDETRTSDLGGLLVHLGCWVEGNDDEDD